MTTLTTEIMDRINLELLGNQVSFLFESLGEIIKDLDSCLKLQNLVENDRADAVFVALESIGIDTADSGTEDLKLVFSSEGIVQDVIDGVKKILNAIWEAIKKVFRFIFRIEKKTDFIAKIDEAFMEKIRNNKYKLPSKSEHEKIMKGFEDFTKLIKSQLADVANKPADLSSKMLHIEVTKEDPQGNPLDIEFKWSSAAVQYLKEMNIKPKDADVFFSMQSGFFGPKGKGGIEPVSFENMSEKTLGELGYTTRDGIKKNLDKLNEIKADLSELGNKPLTKMFESALKEVGVTNTKMSPKYIKFMVEQTTDAIKLVSVHFTSYHSRYFKTFENIFKATAEPSDEKKDDGDKK